jgi:2-amino-4-hydroxy-6-hydroxymethyldihydropteridine diphosphokinase
MNASLISLGANLGHVRESMMAAKHLLEETFGHANLQFSHLYRTPPVGGPSGQQMFLNAVASIHSDCTAWEIWESIKRIELTLGRNRQHRWEARRIDIDLLLHNDQRIWTPHLKVPHPRMCMRSFVLIPAAEVAAHWVDPVTGWSIEHLNNHLHRSRTDGSEIVVICESDQQRIELQTAFASHETRFHGPIRWDVMRRPAGALAQHSTSYQSISTKLNNQPRLTIVTVASPDPLTILWEDVSAPWARWMRLSDSPIEIDQSLYPLLQGPRYLLPSNDVAWTIHELHAANDAMNSWIEISERFDH